MRALTEHDKFLGEISVQEWKEGDEGEDDVGYEGFDHVCETLC